MATDRGTVYLLREVQTPYGGSDEIEIEIPYTITKGYSATYDDPGADDEVEILPPAGVELTDAEYKDLETRAAENHEWDDGDDYYDRYDRYDD